MSKPILTAAAAASLVLASCFPPPPAPPPRFNPRPPYPPEPVEPYDRNYDPYGNDDDAVDRHDDNRLSNPDPEPQRPTRPGEYPTARKTVNPNEVISPYEPYNVIDVEGFRSGQLARDPSNQKIFRVP